MIRITARHSKHFFQIADQSKYDLHIVGSVDEAIAELDNNVYDMALLDMRLTADASRADFSGLAVAKYAGMKGTPCIMITNHRSVEAAQRAIRSRRSHSLIHDFVLKKQGPNAILQAVENDNERPRAFRHIACV